MARLSLLIRTILATMIGAGAAEARTDTGAHETDEHAAWQAARSANSRDALAQFLTLYPAGIFAAEAFAVMVEISLAEEPAFADISDAADRLY